MKLKGKRKRLLGIISAALVVTMLPCMSFAATTHEVYDSAELNTAVTNAVDEDTVKLMDDITIGNNASSCIKVENKSITLDLNGKTLEQTITDPGLSVAAIAVRPDAELTITDSAGGGKISATKTAVQVQGTLNLESGTIACDAPPTNADKDADFAYPIWIYIANEGDKPVFNMTGGALAFGEEQAKFTHADAISFDETYATKDNNEDITINISGGNIQGGLYMKDEASISITGGTFKDADVTKYLTAGEYEQKADGTVVKKTETKTTETAVNKDTSPKTGDDMTFMAAAALAISAIATAMALRRKAA